MLAAGTEVKTIDTPGNAYRVVLHESTNKAIVADRDNGIAVIDIQDY